MLKRLPAAFAAVSLAVVLAGCGAARAPLAAKLPATAPVRAADESDHEQMNAIVKGVLTTYMPHLLATADANHDGAIAAGELGKGRSADAAKLFFAQFDADKNGAVTAAEFDKALAGGAPVEAYHHFTEEKMEAAIASYVADKDFDASDLREYLTTGLGLTADFPFLFSLMGKLDLNEDGKLLSAKGEGPAFMLTFARPQLQHELGMPTSMEDSLRRR